MTSDKLLRAILPDVLIDNFDVVNFEKTEERFDIWLDEKNVQLRQDKKNPSVISHGFSGYHVIQDFPIRGRATYLHVRKRKWLNKDTGEIFSYDWELSEYDQTRLNSEFVSFLKEGDLMKSKFQFLAHRPARVFLYPSMLPYFRSMEAFSLSINVPTSWQELTSAQLAYIYQLLGNGIAMDNTIFYAFMYCPRLHIIKAQDEME